MALVLLRYDLRAPAWGKATHAELYAACLDQCAWAEDHGIGLAVLSEHHGVEDGYLSSPLVMAAAIAGRTRTLGISIQAMLAPFHDPIRLAEDIAAVELVSGGRLSVTLGLGYRDEEFEMFGVDRKRRVALLEEAVDVLRKAWTGEPFEHRGRQARVTPTPPSPPMIFIGGSVAAGARRAARLRLPFMAASDDQSLKEVYDETCREIGFDGGFAFIPTDAAYVHIAEDPDAAWEQVGRYMLHDAQTYDSWQQPDQSSAVHVHAEDLDALKATGLYLVLTPDDAVAHAERTGTLLLHPLIGGLPPELGWGSLELFARAVQPRL